MAADTPFRGFRRPTSNFFRMPNEWTDITARIDNLAELKVVEYVLRHTWGFAEYGEPKHITIDEFMRGRKRHDGARMDLGTGLSERGVRYGLGKAVTDGFIEEYVDDRDRGRIKKSYRLQLNPDESLAGEVQMVPAAVQGLHPSAEAEVQGLHPSRQSVPDGEASPAPRSEKDTLESNREKEEPRSARRPARPEPNAIGTQVSAAGVGQRLLTVWYATLTDLKEQIVPVNYARWLARTRLLNHVDGIAVVGVPDQICADQLARRFDPLVRRALGDALGEVVAVRYQVMEA